MSVRSTVCYTICFSLATALGAAPAPTNAKSATAGSPPPLVVLFQSGSSSLDARETIILDRASRAYNEGKPIVMIITGTADKTGGAAANLAISQKRASAVLRALLDRGIPADRFQVVAKGETDLPIPTPRGRAEPQNRRVEITWH